MNLIAKLFPHSIAGAGWVGHGVDQPPRRLTEDEKAASAAKFLAGYAARKRADAAARLIRDKCADLRRGPVVPIPPRETVVADILARRRVIHG